MRVQQENKTEEKKKAYLNRGFVPLQPLLHQFCRTRKESMQPSDFCRYLHCEKTHSSGNDA